MDNHPKHIGIVAGPLLELAQLYGVETFYRDSRGRWRDASADSVAHVLRALGADFDAPTEAAIERAILHRRQQIWQRIVEPVIVAWDRAWPTVVLRLPEGWARGGGAAAGSSGRHDAHVKVELVLEDGEHLRAEIDPSTLPVRQRASIAGLRFCEYGLHLRLVGGSRRRLPLGWHELRVEIGSVVTGSTLISAPSKAWSPEVGAGIPSQGADGRVRPWGVFAPLYALRSDKDWGVGDLADLATLQRWTHDRGGQVVATLPLLATYLDRPFEPAPYRPVSRLFWNELFLDVDSLVTSGCCTAARQLVSSAAFQQELSELRAMPNVDYRRAMALKRMVLEELAQRFFADPGSAWRQAFEAFVRDRPEAEGYARFRAATERMGTDWREWPAAHRHRPPESDDFDESARLYHLFCQWQMEEQLGDVSGKGGCEASGAPGLTAAGLFLDMPLGVHSGGYDAWRWPSLFVDGVSGGAPPDDFFALGQDWNFLPLHPERTRHDGHRYFAASMRQQMRHARYLRLDHVMSLHRLFWVPEGCRPEDGAYVGYPAEELYAVLCVESHRHRTVLVGEDLGTVPPEVRPTMRRHGLLRTWVLQSSLRKRLKDPLGKIPPHAVASINTHDMFPFAGFIAGADVAARVATGQLAAPLAERELRRRAQLVSGLADFLRTEGLLAPGEHTEVAAWLAVKAAASPGAPDRPGEGLGPPGADRAEARVPADSGAARRSAGDAVSLEERAAPAAPPAALLAAALSYLAQSRAELKVLNLEDLWLETRPQNQPGTGLKCPNWCKKAAFSLDDLSKLAGLGVGGGAGPAARVRAIIETLAHGTSSAGAVSPSV